MKPSENNKTIPLIVPFGGSASYTPVPMPRDTLGGKGCGLVTMSKLGLNVPPGFTITTGMKNAYSSDITFVITPRNRVLVNL